MIRLIILVFICNSFLLISQNADSTKRSKFAFGITASSDYCAGFPYTEPTPYGTTIYYNYTTKAKFGFSSGLNFQYNFCKRIGAELSILYSTKGEKVDVPTSIWITPNGVIDPSIPNSIYQNGLYYSPKHNSTYTYQFLEVPLKFNFYILNKRFKLFPSIGASANLFIGKKTQTTYFYNDGSTQTETSHEFNSNYIPKMNVALIASIGCSYDLSKRLFIKLEPNFRSFIIPINELPVSSYLYSFGCNAGLYYRF
jgi:hypothetical protein